MSAAYNDIFLAPESIVVAPGFCVSAFSAPAGLCPEPRDEASGEAALEAIAGNPTS